MKALLKNNENQVIDFIANDIYNNHGGTYYINGDHIERVDFTTGYMVAVKNGPVRVGFDLTESELKWLINEAGVTRFIGSWHNEQNGLNIL
jgi:hypothetical protein